MNNEKSPVDALYPTIAECVACDSVVVKKFRSTRTGITIIVANVPGPLVHGFFVVGNVLMLSIVTILKNLYFFCVFKSVITFWY